MKWSETIAFSRPLRGVTLAPPGVKPAPAPAPGVPPAAPTISAADLARREEQAYERGLVEGERRLSDLLMQQRNEVQHLHAGVLQSLRDSVNAVLRDSEETLIEFAFAVATKLVAEIPVSRELVEANIRGALAEAKDATEFLVHLHPDDLELLRHHASPLFDPATAPSGTRFIAAPDVERGGCLVRTEFGAIDNRREARLARLRRAVEP